MTVADVLTEVGFGTAWRAVRRLPERAAYGSFERVADTAWARRGPSVRRLESNLRRVIGPEPDEAELRVLSRNGMRTYLRYWCDAFRLPGWSHERIVDRFACDDQHLLDAAAGDGGVVVALPHMGNWDHAGAWAFLTYGRLTSVAERLKPEGLYEEFLAYRRGLGMDILPLTGGDVDVFRGLAERLRDGAIVALLADRDLTARGVPVEFFGQTATMPAGPASLALVTGRPLLPVTMHYDGPFCRARIHPPVPVPDSGPRTARAAAMTQSVARAFEIGIAAHPQDWHMLQRLWQADLDPARAPREEPA